ncbi:MAG: hypothetical protein EZS26_000268 [Candidatus Ordinivivax streblomastigis]|uniref:Uncharacterized protein n=1 Tax=Candidatus Ordinivivax streblomastigis TaxID=2540710 RepID=A0A5M8P5B2_9BACT|nr:MAG: hypothetical protein EZS26_000268 [Candidatus Ordinivivax streblomastigis]
MCQILKIKMDKIALNVDFSSLFLTFRNRNHDREENFMQILSLFSFFNWQKLEKIKRN